MHILTIFSVSNGRVYCLTPFQEEALIKRLVQLTAVLAIMLPSLALAQDMVQGKVIDSQTGKPVPYVNVLVQGER